MDFAAGSENIGSHFGIPVTSLVTEVHACFKHLAHGDVSHCVMSFKYRKACSVLFGYKAADFRG